MTEQTPTEVVMRQLRPFWGRVTLIESPLDEAQRASGIIVPVGGDDVKRGVVLAVDAEWDESTPGRQVGEQLPPGTPVYYRNGTKIGDVVVVDCADILAYEAPD